MRRFLPFAFLAAASAVCAQDAALVRGTGPVFSPDGARVAFRRFEDGVFKLGVFELAAGGTEWIEEGPGNAAYPAWTPDGALVYTFGHDSETAYEAWQSGSTNGYGLRIREPDGTKRDLTGGRCRDYTPCVSPDGRSVYFVTTRGVASASAAYNYAAAPRLARLDLGAPDASAGVPRRAGDVEVLLDAPHGHDSGYVQPAVSPDGSLVVWGQMRSGFEGWRICGTRADRFDLSGVCPVTPSSLAALSPRWHPDGRTICFTGFRAGDPGWGVWVFDVRTGLARRLATGENPCFSPDGASLAYDRDGTVFVRPFGPEDAPDERLPDRREEDAPETSLWATNGIASEAAADIAGDGRFAFGDDAVLFVRATVRLGGGKGVRQIVTGEYAEHPRAFQLYASGGELWFVSRDHAGKFFAAKAPLPAGRSDVAVVAVRTPSRLLLSVDGAPPRVAFTGGALPLDTPLRLVCGTGLAGGAEIRSLELGAGWPQELPKPPAREELFP